jgi:tetratricopeptide (TPR) repeat protein
MAVIQSWIDDSHVNLMGIVGLGGMGKSALAAYFYDNFSPTDVGANVRSPLQHKFWADVSLNPDFAAFAESTIKGLGGNLNPTGDTNVLIANLFKVLHQNRCLLVVDNVETLLDEFGHWRNESYAMFFQRWKQQGHTSILLLTTQDKPTLYKGDNYWHSLGSFQVAEGKTLLQQLHIEGSDRDLESLVKKIDGHPLTLNLVAGYLREYCDCQLSQVTELGLDEFELIYNEASGLHRNITDARLSWILQQHLDRLTEKQREFLVNLSIYRQAFDVTAATRMYLNANLAEGKTQETIKPIEVKKELQNLVNRSLLSRSEEKGYLCPQLLKPYLHKQYPNLTQSHQTAIAYYLSIVTPKPWTNRDDLQGYLEIFYHYYQLGEYDTAFDSLRRIDGFMTLQGYYDLQVEYYLDLVTVYQERGDKSNWKYTASLTDLGNAYYSLGQYQQAIQYHQQSLAITTEIGDLAEGEIRKAARNGEASSYGNLGNAYNSLGQYQQAIQYHQQSLAITTEIGDRKGEASSYLGLGNAYYSLGQYQQAIQYYQQSLAITTEIGDLAEGEIRKAARKGEATSYNNLGNAYYSLGQYQQAIQYHQQSLAITTEIGDRNGEANSYNSLGNAYNSLGQYQEAIQYHQQSLAIKTEIGDRNGEAYSYNNLGSAYYSLGQYQQAIQYYQQSLAIKTEIGDRKGEAYSYNNLGLAYDSLGEYQQAIQYYQQSLAITTEIGDRNGEANSYNNLGLAYDSLGEYQQAIDYYLPALQLYQELGNPHTVIICLDNLGKTYRALKQYPQAIKCYQAILEIKRNLEDKEGEERTLITLGQIYQQSGKSKEGDALSTQGIQILQELGLPVSEMPYPQWLKSWIQFAQRGKIQLSLCFVVGVIGFPFALVGLILLLIWRWVKSVIS